jgi:NADH-quinone oxidoreductase subunit G
MEEMKVKIQIDGITYETDRSKNLLQTCLGLGFDIPHFCFHPAMGSVGACRQCAVKKYSNADDKKGRIVMSCMEPVAEGLIITTNDKETKAFRAAIIESLMTNHPQDCPVCDEGGECHLQDMTVMTGHDYRRFIFRKRTYLNQYLGPFINHEMNRCIQCYRCLRFYTDYAGGTDLAVSGSANRVYFGRHKDGVLESEFSGNLVEVCPTGVFTDKTLKNHYVRKWDMTNAPSLCVHCSLGCNTIAGERYGSVRRILSRYSSEVNGYFLCDRGRFGYEFLNDAGRIKQTMIKTSSGNLQACRDEEIMELLKAAVKGKKLTGIGSPRASIESNYALETLVGKENFYHGVSAKEYLLTKTALGILNSWYSHSPSLKEIEKSDAILILGEDITNTAPMLALSVRQASRNKSLKLAEKSGIPLWNDAPVRELGQQIKTPLFIASPFSTKLDSLAEDIYYSIPENIAQLGFEVASLIDSSAPSPENAGDKLKTTARKIAAALMQAENPLIITGFQNRSEALLQVTANIAIALSKKDKKPSLSIVFPVSNSAGLGLLDGRSVEDITDKKEGKDENTLIILENDIYRSLPQEIADLVFSRFKTVVVLDHLITETAEKADILLAAGTFAESTGTIVSNEGRAQRFYRVLPRGGQVNDSWKLINEMIRIRDENEAGPWRSFDDIVDSLVLSCPVFSKIKECMPDSGFRIFNEKIARQTIRFSGRTAMNAVEAVSEPEPPRDDDSPLTFSMEGFKGIPPADLVPWYWSPGWNSVQAMYKYIAKPDDTGMCKGQGVLLFSGAPGFSAGYFKNIPEVVKMAKGSLTVVPVHLIFGSEELSSKSKSVAERIPEPFILMNRHEIDRLKAAENEKLRLSVNNTLIEVVVKADENMDDGTAGLSVIVNGMPFSDLPGPGKAEKAKQ